MTRATRNLDHAIMLILLLLSISLADSLYENDYPELAVIEYKREFHFKPELYQQKEKRLRYTLALLKTKRLEGIEEAAKMQTDYTALEPEFKTSIARQLIDIGFYSSAEEYLTGAEEKKLLGYVYLLEGDMLRAREMFLSCNEEKLARETSAFLARRQKSITKAMLLSVVFPGAGEIYAGDIKLGIFDFILSFGSGYLVYDAMHDKRYVDAGLAFTFLFNRFWFGSISNAGRLAVLKNEATREKWLNRIKYQYFTPSR